VQHDTSLKNGATLETRADYGWQDEHVALRAAATQVINAPYGLLSLRIGYTPLKGRWDVALHGTNLTNQWYQAGGFLNPYSGLHAGVVARPREVGVTLRVRF
jgi:hypothetical protein